MTAPYSLNLTVPCDKRLAGAVRDVVTHAAREAGRDDDGIRDLVMSVDEWLGARFAQAGSGPQPPILVHVKSHAVTLQAGGSTLSLDL